MTTIKIMIPMMRQIFIFVSFHHMCLRTLFAPFLKPCAEVCRPSVLSCSASKSSPR